MANAINGPQAGASAVNANWCGFYGPNAGEFFQNGNENLFLGPSAGRYAKDTNGATFIGIASGYFAKWVNYSTIVGYAAARYIENNTYSIIMGYAAGEYANRSHQSVFEGMHAGYMARDSEHAVAIGRFAGAWADHSPGSVFIGPEAGGVYKTDQQTEIPSAHHVTRGVYIGSGAGKDSAETTDVVLIGTNTTSAPEVCNSAAIGKGATVTASNQIVLGNDDVTEIVIGGVTITKTQILALLGALAPPPHDQAL